MPPERCTLCLTALLACALARLLSATLIDGERFWLVSLPAPGFVMSMYSLLRSSEETPTEEDIEDALGGNLW